MPVDERAVELQRASIDLDPEVRQRLDEHTVVVAERLLDVRTDLVLDDQQPLAWHRYGQPLADSFHARISGMHLHEVQQRLEPGDDLVRLGFDVADQLVPRTQEGPQPKRPRRTMRAARVGAPHAQQIRDPVGVESVR